MITYMQFIENNTSLSTSEANEDAKITIIMEDLDNREYGYSLEFTKPDIILLRDWLNKALEDLET